MSGTALSSAVMKIQLNDLSVGIKLWLDLRRDGLAFISEFQSPIESLPRGSATLVLRWAEVVVICLISGILQAGIHFRREILNSWLIAGWAAHNRVPAALAMALVVVVVGLILFLWEKNQLFLYSISEIIFGAFSAFQAALALFEKLDTDSLVALAAIVYLVASGIKHLVKALKEEVGRVHWEMTKGTPHAPWPPSILPPA